MADAFQTYFRCAGPFSPFEVASGLSANQGYFRFDGSVCYGRCAGASPSPVVAGTLPQVSIRVDGGRLALPFDVSEVVTNLQEERYPGQEPVTRLARLTETGAARAADYFARPFLPVGIRKHFQKLRLRGWTAIPFPAWPVDVTIQSLMQSLMGEALRRADVERIPFVWFWPDGAESCVVMTHDVEGRTGRDFCARLVDLDESFGIRSAFQIVPEWSAGSADGLVETLRRRGCEVNIHDLNHDGALFRDRDQFDRRAAQINRHARALGCRGFRSGAMYREESWYEELDFSYDMSVPNVAHLEPQRGGCCTAMPYFIGNILELPLTTTQDYSLFHILNDYSTALWKQQIDLIRSKNGLITFITHPDYLVEARARAVYIDLLAHLSALRSDGQLWMALPGEVDDWWRSRQQMSVVRRGGVWTVEGPGSDRARLAHARLQNDRVVYEVAGAPAP